MAESHSSRRNRGLTIAVVTAVVLIALVSALFLFEVFSFSQESSSEPQTDDQLEARAARLVERGVAERGAAAVETYQCVACHVIGAENQIAPPFAGIAAYAAERKPPLSAAAYLYESIIHPGAFIVDGYQNVMASNYEQRLSEQELADILAYLLTQTDER